MLKGQGEYYKLTSGKKKAPLERGLNILGDGLLSHPGYPGQYPWHWFFTKKNPLERGFYVLCDGLLSHPGYPGQYHWRWFFMQKKSPVKTGLLKYSWRRPTFPHGIAVSLAQAGLTTLFGKGRGGPCRFNHPRFLDPPLWAVMIFSTNNDN